MTSLSDGGVRLSEKINEMIAQMINHQGNVVARASEASAVNFTLNADPADARGIWRQCR